MSHHALQEVDSCSIAPPLPWTSCVRFPTGQTSRRFLGYPARTCLLMSAQTCAAQHEGFTTKFPITVGFCVCVCENLTGFVYRFYQAATHTSSGAQPVWAVSLELLCDQRPVLSCFLLSSLRIMLSCSENNKWKYSISGCWRLHNHSLLFPENANLWCGTCSFDGVTSSMKKDGNELENEKVVVEGSSSAN